MSNRFVDEGDGLDESVAGSFGEFAESTDRQLQHPNAEPQHGLGLLGVVGVDTEMHREALRGQGQVQDGCVEGMQGRSIAREFAPGGADLALRGVVGARHQTGPAEAGFLRCGRVVNGYRCRDRLFIQPVSMLRVAPAPE